MLRRGQRRLISWFICVQLCLMLCQSSLTANIEQLHSDVPSGCRVIKARGGINLDCFNAAFDAIISTVRQLGKQLVGVSTRLCWPRQAVSLNASCFANNTNLRKISLTLCAVEVLGNGTFAKLESLKRLDLGYNAISSFTAETFKGLSSLTELVLRWNQLNIIAPGSFKEMTNLTSLNLRNNRITAIYNDTFEGISKLKYLFLDYNLIKTITAHTFGGLPKLGHLSISSNKIEILQNELFKNIRNLTVLSLAGNAITKWPESVSSDLVNLEQLFLTDCYKLFLTGDPNKKFLNGLRRLQSLALGRVYLPQLAEGDMGVVFKDQRESLKELFLQGSEITNDLLPMIKNLKQLELLDLTNNEIGYIKQSSLPKLAANGGLYLEGNKIAYVDEGAFAGMHKESVKLGRNALDCSCKHADFSRWLRSPEGAVVVNRGAITCNSPVDLYGTRVMDYDPIWWQCSQYIPLVALVFIISFFLLLGSVGLIISCNWVNIRHWILERRITRSSSDEDGEDEPAAETAPLLQPGFVRNSLRQGKTGTYIIHNIYDTPLLNWVNKYIEEQLFQHPMKITLQFPAGPQVIPLWKQVKDFSFQVHSFLVLVSDDFLENHWPDIAEKSGIENIMKCVFVLHGKKRNELPKEMIKLRCACFEWPESGTRFTNLARERDQFLKQIRLAIMENKVAR